MSERVVVSGGGGVEYRLGTLREGWLVAYLNQMNMFKKYEVF